MKHINDTDYQWLFSFIIFIIFWFLLGPYLVKILWNWLMPQLFADVGLLTWWKSFTLCVMVRLIVSAGFNINKK